MQGGMAWLSTAELAAAVSNAGGLGVFTAANFTTKEELRDEIRKTKSLTDKPFAVNVTFGPTRRPVSTEEYLDVAIGEGLDIVETSGQSPEPYMKQLKQAGIKVIHKAPGAVRFARTAEEVGCDAVSIIGYECGGRLGPDETSSLVLIRAAVETLKIPVIAGGGFADAQGFVAALVLGADAVLMGTRFMATKECPISEKHKQFLANTKPTDPKLRERCLAPPNLDEVSKVLAQRDSMPEHEWLWKLEKAMVNDTEPVSLEGASAEEVEAEVLRSVPGSLAVGVIDSIPTIREYMESLISEAEKLRHRWAIP